MSESCEAVVFQGIDGITNAQCRALPPSVQDMLTAVSGQHRAVDLEDLRTTRAETSFRIVKTTGTNIREASD